MTALTKNSKQRSITMEFVFLDMPSGSSPVYCLQYSPVSPLLIKLFNPDFPLALVARLFKRLNLREKNQKLFVNVE